MTRAPGAPPDSSPPLTPPPDGGDPLRVLVVDDDELVVRVTKRILKHHAVDVAESRAGALALLGGERPYDVILLDLHLASESGIDVYEAIQAQHPAQLGRVVLMTGGATDERSATFLAEVSNVRLDKPFGPPDLRAVIQRVRGGGL